MLKIALGAFVGVIGMAIGVVAWLLWPSPSVELNWEAMAEEFIQQEDCIGAAQILGNFGSVDRIGFHDVVDNSFQKSVCAISEDSENPTDRYFLDRLYALDPELVAMETPVPWWEGAKAAAKRWDDNRWYRGEIGLDFAGWTDAITFFRCERTLGHFPAANWLSARDGLFYQFPDFVAPFDAHRARCIAFVEAEYVRIETLAAESEFGDSPAFQQLINDYSFLLHLLKGSMETIQEAVESS